MKRILIPTDFSPHADAALAHAQRFTELLEAELHLLSVQVPYGPTSPLIDQYPDESDAWRTLEKLAGESPNMVIAVKRAIAVAPAILDYADEHDIDLIVMGSHGRRGIPRMLLGSVAEEVIRAGEWPVLTVNEDSPAPAYSRILAPVDFSDRTEDQLAIAHKLAVAFDAELEVVHSIDPPTVPELYMPIAPLAVDMAGTTKRALEQLEKVTAPYRDIRLNTDVLVGRAVAQIIDRIEAGADLVVLPTHGYSGVDRVLLGSVTEGVLRRSNAPVLVLKAEHMDEGREALDAANEVAAAT